MIKIPKSLLEDLKFWFSRQGTEVSHLSNVALVRRAIDTLIASSPEALPEPSLTSPDIRGQVADFAQRYDWTGLSREVPVKLSPSLKEALQEAQKEVQAECVYSHEGAEVLCREALPLEKPIQTFPPWEGLKRLPLDEIKLRYPRHRLLREVVFSETHQLAVECAFGSLPAEMQKEPKVFVLYRDLLQKFQEWIVQKGEKK